MQLLIYLNVICNFKLQIPLRLDHSASGLSMVARHLFQTLAIRDARIELQGELMGGFAACVDLAVSYSLTVF